MSTLLWGNGWRNVGDEKSETIVVFQVDVCLRVGQSRAWEGERSLYGDPRMEVWADVKRYFRICDVWGQLLREEMRMERAYDDKGVESALMSAVKEWQGKGFLQERTVSIREVRNERRLWSGAYRVETKDLTAHEKLELVQGALKDWPLGREKISYFLGNGPAISRIPPSCGLRGWMP